MASHNSSSDSEYSFRIDRKKETDARIVLKRYKQRSCPYGSGDSSDDELYRADDVFYVKDPAPDIIRHCAETGRKFVDTQFPPTEASLVGFDKHEDDRGLDKEDEIFKRKVKWLRPDDMKVEGPRSVYVDGAAMSDIKQGHTGDCWFLSMISAVAHEHPDTIEGLIKPSGISPCGVYSVALFLDGERHYILVDDLFPCVDGKPLFCRSTAKGALELWPLILEKALAKWCGCYIDVSGSQIRRRTVLKPEYVYEAFSGAPAHGCLVMKEMETDHIIDDVITLEDERFVMTAGCHSTEHGLHANHAYSVLGIEDRLPDGIVLVRLRNPWGDKEWTGRWSDNSREWKRAGVDPRKFHHKQDKNDGVFFMHIDDFVDNFRCVQFVGPGDAFFRPDVDESEEEHHSHATLPQASHTTNRTDTSMASHRAPRKGLSKEARTAVATRGAEEWRAYRRAFNQRRYFEHIGVREMHSSTPEHYLMEGGPHLRHRRRR